ncbi:hypothetical protein CMQ_3301 [Grosmannia clavigera kw1407]|uniref:Uncharacterized protein n=1 Tax=Grosmannia clavigera (strain kw1407 / UAMH 11150) TaxID=655863 RepID=F0X960_GROCL|nr:uncharacterized protein CMQ_3301 [Grosmannia clavigera kw1407]EFX05232.1 hypothetical protein CMQ_3301 [Grosmannia clavigera kw1407]
MTDPLFSAWWWIPMPALASRRPGWLGRHGTVHHHINKVTRATVSALLALGVSVGPATVRAERADILGIVAESHSLEQQRPDPERRQVVSGAV